MIKLSGKGTDKVLEIGRIIGTYGGDEPGVTVVFVGGIHGNEPAGVFAIFQILEELRSRNLPFRGKFYGIAGNLSALSGGVRFLDADLNRIWAPNGELKQPIRESAERAEIIHLIESILKENNDPLMIFDLHTTSSRSIPFVAIGDTLRNRATASRFPVPIVLGLEEHMKGTLFSFLSRSGISSLIFEAGQHDSPDSISNHINFIWQALVVMGNVDKKALTVKPKLNARSFHATIMETVFRYSINDGDPFEVIPGFSNFDRVEKSSRIATHNGRVVYPPEKGRIFLPLYQKQGRDGFFIVQKVNKFWLFLSAVVRKLKLDRHVHRLPGVSRHPELKSAYLINRSVAKWLAVQIFHLLGFRMEKSENDFLIMKRREFDFAPPSNDTILQRINLIKEQLP